ncbi:phage tail length tape measure family protein [Pseudomonas sp.]|uniref:phage tail length tape measure family protein n=1 Tax=Pseudomonas sp. TaxID=306 RepID=UPI001B2576E9|nr:phage tail length tape measure family protein [Pseudomonas sp.]MBO9552233.1 phage tail length tape measure family protein [Pseudomonas sp.]
MAQESRLAVTIDSRGAKRNADDLSGSLERMERAGEGATSSADGLSSSLDDQRKELSQLLGSINPTIAALGRLDDMQERLAKFKGTKLLDADTFSEYSDRINTLRQGIGESAEGMNKAGMSAKAYQAALRGVPAQFTDIAVSLQGGQAPLTVFLQQGGQLKDMFGGIAPAAKALGGYILGLVNPFTIAATAAGALALSYYKGSEQSDALRDSLILTGNFSKASEAQLISLAESADQVTGTFGQAAGALAQLTAASVNTTGNLKLITTTAVEMQRVTGKAVEDTVAEFIKLGKDPVAGIVELDEKYRFLTASVYSQIKALLDQGNAVAAADLAERTYAEAMGQRTSKIRENLGLIERGWLNIKDATNEVLDAFASIGRKSVESEDKAITRLQQKIAFLQSTLGTEIEDNDAKESISSLQAELKQRQGIQQTNAKTLEEEEKRRRIQEEGRKGLQDLDTTYKSSLTQMQRLNNELTDLDKARAKALAAGVFSASEEAKYTQSRKNIEKEISDIKEREAKKNTPKGASKGVSEAETTFARLYNQYDPAAQAARALTKEQTQLQLALDKGKISQEEYGKALAQASINYAAAIKGARGLTQAEQYRAQLDRQLETQRAQYDTEAAAVGMGGLQSERMQQRIRLEQDTNDRILQLRTELANATTEKQRQDLQAQIDLTTEYLPKQLQAMQVGWGQIDQQLLNSANGWTAALQNFQNSANDIAGQTQAMFSNAFNGISVDAGRAFESMIFDGMTFGDAMSMITENMVRGVVSALGEMAARWAVNAALNATLGASAAATNIALAGTTASAWAPAAAMASLATMGANAVPAAAALASTTTLAAGLAVVPGFATGGYVSGAGSGTSDSITARLSNGEFVVNAEATKRNRSLLEAINSNERVSVSGGGGRTIVQSGNGRGGERDKPVRGDISFNFNVSVQAQPGMSDAEARRQGQLAGEGVRDIVRQVIQDEQRPGGMLS